MRRRLRRHSLTSISIVASLVLVLAAVWAGVAVAEESPPTGPTEWLKNQGFEEFYDDPNVPGDLDPINWDVDEPAPEAAKVVEEKEGAPSEWDLPIYGTMGLGGQDLGPMEGGGDSMLRLGVVRDKNSHQIKGPITVSQDFYWDGSRSISLVYRAFTWDHRSGDYLIIEVKEWAPEGNGDLAVGNWSIAGLPDEPSPPPGVGRLQFKAPIKEPAGGKEKYAYSSNWRKISINLDSPANAGPFTISYTLTNDANASHDTWVYLDHINEPPVAQFTWAPGGPLDLEGNPTPLPRELPHEGDVIGLYGDLSYDPDGEIVEWKWEITGLAEPIGASPVGFIVPHDEGDYGVTLTVTDDEGATGTIGPLSIPPLSPIQVANYDPRVNALNVEVLEGSDAEFQLVGRFLDPGWMDEHTARWISPSGSETPEIVEEDNYAPVSSGYVSGSVAATAAGEWTLRVDDGDGGVGTDKSVVTVISQGTDLREPDSGDDPDVFPDVEEMVSDGAYLSFIQEQGDVDIFEVLLPDGSPLPTGTELLVTLRGSMAPDWELPADYDLVVFERAATSGGDAENIQSAPFMNSPFMNSPFMNSPFMNSPFMNSPFMNSPFMNSPFMNSPFMHSPFMNSPFMNSPFMNSPFMNSPFMNSPFMNSPFMNSPFMNSPFMHSSLDPSDPGVPDGWTWLDGYPLSWMSFTGAANDNTSGMDISFAELGFDQEDMENLRVLGFSANTGTEAEVVLATTEYPQTTGVEGHVYVAVKSATGQYSDLPYTLQIETSRPFEVLSLELEKDQLPLVENPTTETSVEYVPEGDPLTLFVTQFERLEELYPGGDQSVRSALVSVKDLPTVQGKIISLRGDIYTSWDTKPWLVDEANKVAESIRTEIQNHLTDSIKYVVLVGNDRIIPFRRLIDQTIIGNEQLYADESFLTHSSYEYKDGQWQWVSRPSATLASIANGYILTDDYYVDETPIGWNGSFLYIPDLAISRLVETPAEIETTVAAFGATGGALAATVGLVTGYDFMKDGADRVKDTLGGSRVLISENWTGDDVWNFLDPPGPERDDDIQVGSLNAHFTHFAGLSASGYNQYEQWVGGDSEDSYGQSELLLGRDIATAGEGYPLFKGKLIFSMGCHAGLNIPDEQAVEWAKDDPTNPALDLPQAMMSQGGIYIGSTGYGYGDTVGIAGTEALIGFFAEQLVAGEAVSVGEALAQAKREYLGSLSTLTPYDQKSSVQFVLYGMPQYQVEWIGVGAVMAGGYSGSLAAASSSVTDGEYIGDFQLTLNENPTVHDLYLHSAASGQYIEADPGGFEATADRPIHPVVPVELDSSLQDPAHGFVYTGGTYWEYSSSFQPAISRITTEWEILPDEFQVATTEYWPVQPAGLTTIETEDGYDQTFVVVPAQFKPTQTSPTVVGTERVWSSLQAELLRSSDSDWVPPRVSDVDLWMDHGFMTVSVEADDGDGVPGISRIVVLQMDADHMYTPAGGDHTFGGVPNGPNANGRYELTLDLTGVDPDAISLMIQVVDGAGNVTTLTGKGATIRPPFGFGLHNLSFEEDFRFWELTEPVEGNAAVMGIDELSEPGMSVTPVHPTDVPGAQRNMLRLGTPKDTDAHQVKGVTSVSQQFIADGRPIAVAYFLVSLDNREIDDVFVIDVKDAAGNSAGSWSSADEGDSLPLRVPNYQSMEDWAQIDITGLEAGQIYTLTYTLNNTQSAAHNTWVYVDQGN